MNKIAMTVGQQGLWFLMQTDPMTSAAYNVVLACTTSAALDAALLEHCLAQLAQRHRLLGARIVEQDDLPWFALDGASAPLQVSAATLDEVCAAESARAFDFARGPLYRATIVNPAQGQAGVVFSFPHICFDGLSAPVFMDELSALYAAAGAAPAAPAAEAQGSDAAREAAYLGSAAGRAALAHTAEALRGLPGALALPFKAPPQVQAAYPSGTCAAQLAPALVDGLRQLAQARRCSAAALHLAAFELLLWQYSGQDDFALSVPVSNRSGADSAAIGYLTTLGVVRAALDGETTLGALFEQVSDSMYDLLDRRELPFPAVVRALKAIDADAASALMQLSFNYAGAARDDWRFGAVQARCVPVVLAYAKHQLKLDVEESPAGVRLALAYDSAAFDQATVARMLAHYQVLLEAMLARPEARLRELPLLAAHEREQVLGEWNASAAPYPHQACAHTLFEAQAARTAQAVAVVGAGVRLSYAELDARANQLAHHLRTLGVGPDRLVGLCMDRTPDMLVGLLAILKAGGAYLPLDPEHPPQRLAFLLQETAAAVLLCSAALAPRLPAWQGVTVMPDAAPEAAQIAACPRTAPAAPVEAGHLAYCLYTSGSTGQPKGVAVPHRALVNLLTAAAARLEPAADTVLLAVTPLTFDISALELLLPLLHGGRVVIAPHATGAVPAELVALVREHGVNTLQATPATWRLLQYHGEPLRLALALCGGEALDAPLADYLASVADAAWNMYGPTETTVWSSCQRLGGGALSLGRPLANTQFYVLDRWQQPVAPGVAGELHIAGDGLARGYLRRAALTAAQFVPNPFGPPGSRMYRSGDLARQRDDGRIEYLGRIDQQVKLRGHRIELGEIEHALLACPRVRAAAVLARRDSPGQELLVAYVVLEPGAAAEGGAAEGGAAEGEALRAHLRTRLPEYMVPAAMVLMDALPLNASGKTDRKALPAPAQASPEAGRDFVAPCTATEQVLAALWADALKLPRVGRHDNFFALGGHSLLASKIIRETGEQLKATISVRSLFNAPTVAQLAAQVDQLLAQGVRPAPAPAIRRQARA